jgi:uncharacterized protein
MRVVFDTNIFISSILIENSFSDKALTKAEANFTLIASVQTFDELVNILCLPKFDKYVSLHSRKKVLKYFEKKALFVEPVEKITVCRDPKDNKFLELAVAGNAVCIITGDKDLLVLNPFRNIQIITPKEFLEQF